MLEQGGRWCSQWEAEQAGALLILVLCERPRDWPQSYTLRQQLVTRGSVQMGALRVFDTKAAALAFLRKYHPDMTAKGRLPGDDPVIVGSWM